MIARRALCKFPVLPSRPALLRLPLTLPLEQSPSENLEFFQERVIIHVIILCPLHVAAHASISEAEQCAKAAPWSKHDDLLREIFESRANQNVRLSWVALLCLSKGGSNTRSICMCHVFRWHGSLVYCRGVVSRKQSPAHRISGGDHCPAGILPHSCDHR